MSNSLTEGVRIDPDSLNIDEDDPNWEFVGADEDFITHRIPLERFADGNVMYAYRKMPRGIDGLLEANKQSLNDSETQKTRFGGDSTILNTKVASIPLNVLFDPKYQLAEKIKEGDRDHMKWFLNRDEARPWRTFRGKI